MEVENQAIDSAEAVVEPKEQEEMLPKSYVNKIVKREKAQAAEAARREVEEKYQNNMESTNAIRAQQNERNAQVPKEVDLDATYQKLQERFNEEMRQQKLKDEMTTVAKNYISKIDQGKGAYEDFDEVTKDFDPTLFPQITFLLAGIDNAADVLYDLSNNPLKLAGLDRLAEKNPRQAHNELLKLAKSITDNRQAQSDAESQNVAEPLDRLQPSRVSGSNGKMGIRDLRNQPWLKG